MFSRHHRYKNLFGITWKSLALYRWVFTAVRKKRSIDIPMTRLWGLFLEWEPKRNKDASFLTLKNSWNKSELVVNYIVWVGMVNLKKDYNTTLLIRQVIGPKKTNNFDDVFNIYLSVKISWTLGWLFNNCYFFPK